MLLTMPKDLGEFVIVHELVHLLAPKHGKLFKLCMHAYLPDWEDRERRLQGYVGLRGASGGFRGERDGYIVVIPSVIIKIDTL